MEMFTAQDPRYLRRLLALPKPPKQIWLRGTWDDTLPTVAIVGARAARKTSEQQAYALAQGLAQQGVAIVSGGAMGIDTAAHEGALAGGGRTCAVLGTGVNNPYPRRNHDLFQKMIENRGCLLSSFPPGAEALTWHFPFRNQLIAVLSDVVVLLESPFHSGSRYTAQTARTLGKPIAVLADAPEVKDLRRAGAAPIRSLDDVLSLLPHLEQTSTSGGALPLALQIPLDLPSLSAEAQDLLPWLTQEPKDITILSLQAKIPVSTCAAALLELELHGLCSREAGEKYSRL